MHDSWYYNKFSILFVRRDTRTSSTRFQIENSFENKRRKVVNHTHESLRKDRKSRRRHTLRRSSSSLDRRSNEQQSFSHFFLYLSIAMTRFNFEHSFDTIQKVQFQRISNFLIELQTISNSTNDSKVYINNVKRRQFVFTFDEVEMNDDEILYFLDVINVNQLKWYVENHFKIFLKNFDILRHDRNRLLKVFEKYHEFANDFAKQQKKLNYVNANYDALNTKFKKFKKKVVTIEQRIKKTKILRKKTIENVNERRVDNITFINDNITFIKNFVDLQKKYDVLMIRNERENDDRFIIIIFSNKKRFSKHSNSSKFIDDVNSIWRIWKFAVYDKMTINANHFDIDMIEIIVVIDWIENDAIDHIQFERDFDMIHFKNWQMMLNFLNIVYANFDFVRKIRNEFRNLIMNIQNFQTFFSTFHTIECIYWIHRNR